MDVHHQDFKLLVDPLLEKGKTKLIRYQGGLRYRPETAKKETVVVSDPRTRKFFPKEHHDLRVPRFTIDEHSTDDLPPVEITFSNLNDNVTEDFLGRMCVNYGKLERLKVYFHPSSKKHMGLAKVIFRSIKSAANCLKGVNKTSVMGNVISAVIDSKGEELKRLHRQIMEKDAPPPLPDVIRGSQDSQNRRSHHHHHHHHQQQKHPYVEHLALKHDEVQRWFVHCGTQMYFHINPLHLTLIYKYNTYV